MIFHSLHETCSECLEEIKPLARATKTCAQVNIQGGHDPLFLFDKKVKRIQTCNVN